MIKRDTRSLDYGSYSCTSYPGPTPLYVSAVTNSLGGMNRINWTKPFFSLGVQIRVMLQLPFIPPLSEPTPDV